MRLALALAASLTGLAVPARAGIPAQYGDGRTDATQALQAAVDATPSGGVLSLDAGDYLLSGTILVSKPITIVGTGLGTQLYEQADVTLLRLGSVNGAVIRDVYLGSAATSPETSLLELVNSHHNRVDDVTMAGGAYGLHLKGSLLNTIVDLRSGNNFGGFFAPVSDSKWWVYAERFGAYSCVANTFVAPALEGKGGGISMNDGAGQGSFTVLGGSIEGVSGTAIAINGAFGPSLISGVDMEHNAADVAVNSSSNVTISAVFSTAPITLAGDTRNVLVTGGVVDHIEIAATTKRIRLQNFTTGVTTCSNNVVNANSGLTQDNGPNVVIEQVGNYCAGQ